MSLRYFVPGVVWLCFMALLFLTPQTDPPREFFGFLPSRSVLHGVLFMGFVHIWIAAFKKQLKHEHIRRKAVLLVFCIAMGLSIISEFVVFLAGINPSFSYWNLIFDIAGSGLGILTFKLLYQSCY